MTDAEYMRLALAEAGKGRGTTSPNPMVGAVAVRKGEVIGSGFHPGPGEPHAEVFALDGLGDALADVTLYVTLEPCSITGRTPPCADLILRRGVGRVVCAMEDPDARVSGRGIRRLREAGVDVEVGILAAEAAELNEAYVKHRSTGLPFVTLKLAMTADGYIATAGGDSRWITCEESRARAHALRAGADAVVVGINTVRADDPELSVRLAPGRSPAKIVLDSRLALADLGGARVFGGANLIVACSEDAEDERALKIEAGGGSVWRFSGSRPSLRAVLRRAADEGFLHVLIEGGGIVAGAAVEDDVVDRLILFIAPRLLGGGVRGVEGLRLDSIDESVPLEQVEIEKVGCDLMYVARIGDRTSGGVTDCQPSRND